MWLILVLAVLPMCKSLLSCHIYITATLLIFKSLCIFVMILIYWQTIETWQFYVCNVFKINFQTISKFTMKLLDTMQVHSKMSPVKRICVFEHSVMTNFNCACPAIQRGQGSGFLSEGSSWPTACTSEQRRFWRDCADAQARLNLCCSHRR